MARFLFVLKAGLADSSSPTRCFQFAQVAHQEGHEVNMFLIDDATILARKGITENVIAPSGEELDVAMEYMIQNKVTIYVCTPCAKLRGVTEDSMVEGAQYATAKKLIELAADSKVLTF
jgi:predicted peroxiredoxin